MVDLVLQHPLMAGERMDHLLRSHLKSAYDRTCVSARSKGHTVVDSFGENFHLSVPSESFGDHSLQIENMHHSSTSGERGAGLLDGQSVGVS